MKMSAEDEALWDVMQIAEFPMDYRNGLWFVPVKFLGDAQLYANREKTVATADFARVKKSFYEWTERR